MIKIFATVLSIIHYTVFGLILVLFHPVQVIAFKVFGYKAHKITVDALNFLLVQNFFTLFCRPTFHGFNKLPQNRPLIIVSNHQSMYDVPPVAWFFRKHHVKFISKKELGKSLPSVSYNLRHGGSVLIDRKSGSQSIREIFKLGKKMEKRNWSACLFPEGTRSKNGRLKQFHPAGLKTLLKSSPSALIVPFAIDGNYKFHRFGKFPLNIGIRLKYTALEPIERKDLSAEELSNLIKDKIQEAL